MIAVVTGGSAGIGTEVARGLAKLGIFVVVHGRSPQRTQAVCDRIVRDGGSAEAFLADFARLDDVQRLAREVTGKYPTIDILVNNAGVASSHRTVTAEGYETTFAVNHLAPYLLTRLLLDRLRAAPKARIVTVASGAHKRGRMEFENLQRVRDYSAWDAYAQSKLANVLFTRALAKRLQGTNVTATCCHPGMIATDIWGISPAVRVVAPLAKLFMKSPAQGADTPLWLATSPEVEGQSGGYYAKRKLARTAPAAQDDFASEILWERSAQMTGVRWA